LIDGYDLVFLAKSKDGDYHQGMNSFIFLEWFKGGKLNVAYNCIDRHLPQRANQTAIIWEGDNPEVNIFMRHGSIQQITACGMQYALRFAC
jgi:acetyl-CoA synthetase